MGAALSGSGLGATGLADRIGAVALPCEDSFFKRGLRRGIFFATEDIDMSLDILAGAGRVLHCRLRKGGGEIHGAFFGLGQGWTSLDCDSYLLECRLVKAMTIGTRCRVPFFLHHICDAAYFRQNSCRQILQ